MTKSVYKWKTTTTVQMESLFCYLSTNAKTRHSTLGLI